MTYAVPIGGCGRFRRRPSPTAYAIVDDADAEFVKTFNWWSTRAGYATCQYGYMHRLLLGLGHGGKDKRHVDHVNGCKMDNRRANLRVATASQNLQNSRRMPGKSGVRGVSWYGPTGKWCAKVVVRHADGSKHTKSKYCDTKEEAAAAHLELRRLHHPFSPEARGELRP
jgi:hypothetical protein